MLIPDARTMSASQLSALNAANATAMIPSQRRPGESPQAARERYYAAFVAESPPVKPKRDGTFAADDNAPIDDDKDPVRSALLKGLASKNPLVRKKSLAALNALENDESPKAARVAVVRPSARVATDPLGRDLDQMMGIGRSEIGSSYNPATDILTLSGSFTDGTLNEKPRFNPLFDGPPASKIVQTEDRLVLS